MRPDEVHERLARFDAGSTSLPELMALGFAKSAAAVEGSARAVSDLLREKGGNPRRIADVGPDELADRFGLDPFEVRRVQALIEIGRKAAGIQRDKLETMDTADAAYEHVKDLGRETREHFVALLCDSQMRVRARKTIHIGTLTASMVGPREVFREAIREAASTIIVAHNHPSGDPTPSPEDVAVTKRLVEVGNLLDIPVVDHLVIGDGRYVSLKRKRLM